MDDCDAVDIHKETSRSELILMNSHSHDTLRFLSNSVSDHRQTSPMGSRSQEYNNISSRSPDGVDCDLERNCSSRHGNSHEVLLTAMGPMRQLSNDLNILLLPSFAPSQRRFTPMPTSNIIHNRSPRLVTGSTSLFLRPRFSSYSSQMNHRGAIQASGIVSLINENPAPGTQNTLDSLISSPRRNLDDWTHGTCSETSVKSSTSSEHMGGTSPISELIIPSQQGPRRNRWRKSNFFKMLHNIKKSNGKDIKVVKSEGQEELIVRNGLSEENYGIKPRLRRSLCNYFVSHRKRSVDQILQFDGRHSITLPIRHSSGTDLS